MSMASEVMCAAVRELAGLLDQPTGAIPGGLVRGLDPSSSGQRARAQAVTEGGGTDEQMPAAGLVG